MPKTKLFRVATSGPTTDGRQIDPQTLHDMAATYDPATYQARVNLEHYISAHPESAFGAYGDVLSLKTEPVTLNIGGQPQQRVALMAEIDAMDRLVDLKGRGQKLFTSIEVTPNFAGSSKPYLTGLAFTDNPASLGTEMMKFRQQASDFSPLCFRDTQKGALFTVPHETTFEFAEATPAGAPGANPSPETNAIMDALRRVFGGFATPPAPAPALSPAPEPAADPALAAAYGF
jgi:hypothetical protein